MRASNNRRPDNMKCSGWKCLSLCSPLSAPQKLASIVKTLGIFSSRHNVTLAVDSLDLCTEKREYSKEKKSQSFDIMNGKTRVECGLSEKLLPYIKMFLRREWP